MPTPSSSWSSIPPRLFLAVDCGGTSAKASISDEHGVILGSAKGGAANFTDVPTETFLQSVATAVQLALRNAGIRRRHLREWDRVRQREREKEKERREKDKDKGKDKDKDKDGHHDEISHSQFHSNSNSNSNPQDPSNSLNRNTSISSIGSSCNQARLISLPPSIPLFTSAWFGIAGVDSSSDVLQVSPLLSHLLNLPFPSSRLIVANDTSLLASPIHDSTTQPRVEHGVVLIAGTGSIVTSFTKDRNGLLKTVGRIGGFGWLLGDEGSGYSVGRNALRAVLDQADRERLISTYQLVPNSSTTTTTSTGNSSSTGTNHRHLLRDRILQEWNLTSTDDLLNAIYTSRNPIPNPLPVAPTTTTPDTNPNSIPTPTDPSRTNGGSSISQLPSDGNPDAHLNPTSTLDLLRERDLPSSTSTSTSTSTFPIAGNPISQPQLQPQPQSNSQLQQPQPSDPSSNLLPPKATPFYGEDGHPPPPSSPIPPLVSNPVSRERSPDLMEDGASDSASASEDEQEEVQAEAGKKESESRDQEVGENGGPNGSHVERIIVSSQNKESNHHHHLHQSSETLNHNHNHVSKNSNHERSRSDSNSKLINPVPVFATLNFDSQSPQSPSSPTPTSTSTCNAGAGAGGAPWSKPGPISFPAAQNSSNHQGHSHPQPHPQPPPPHPPQTDLIGERKHRLASLAPLVFHLAFSHRDELSLSILKKEIREIGDQIIDLIRPDWIDGGSRSVEVDRGESVAQPPSSFQSQDQSQPQPQSATGFARPLPLPQPSLEPASQSSLRSILPTPQSSVLCLGGSLLSVEKYRNLLRDYLASRNVRFARMEFVEDPSRSAAGALAGMWRAREERGEK